MNFYNCNFNINGEVLVLITILSIVIKSKIR